VLRNQIKAQQIKKMIFKIKKAFSKRGGGAGKEKKGVDPKRPPPLFEKGKRPPLP
jgi:hypothetical protein